MGATKLNIKHISSINTDDLAVLGFELCDDMKCRFVLNQPIPEGEVVLIKASFKDACEAADVEDENVLYRRRVVPFVTRVKKALAGKKQKGVVVSAQIENITEDDRSYFYRKYFAENDTGGNPLEMDIEGKHIIFAGA